MGRADVNMPPREEAQNALTMTLLEPPALRIAARILCDAVKKDWVKAGKPQGLWGFKVPKTITAVAIWRLLFSRHLFIHVTRDPRTTCTPSSNFASFAHLCAGILDRPFT